MRSLEVLGVRVDAPSGAPVLLLRDQTSGLCLPIWIGAAEAAAIVTALEGEEPERPMTHDLFAEIMTRFCQHQLSGHITNVQDGVFHAELHIGEEVITARPSDVVALAVRLGFSLQCSEALMAEVGVELSSPAQDEVERFREFLDTVNAEDFEEQNP